MPQLYVYFISYYRKIKKTCMLENQDLDTIMIHPHFTYNFSHFYICSASLVYLIRN